MNAAETQDRKNTVAYNEISLSGLLDFNSKYHSSVRRKTA